MKIRTQSPEKSKAGNEALNESHFSSVDQTPKFGIGSELSHIIYRPKAPNTSSDFGSWNTEHSLSWSLLLSRASSQVSDMFSLDKIIPLGSLIPDPC